MKSNPRIRIGMQSAFSAETILAPFRYAVRNGFEAFEWLPDKKESGAGWQESDVDTKTRRYIKKTALKHDIRISVHVPWDLNPAKPESEKRLLETIAFAKDVNASLLNIHLFADQGVDTYTRGIIPLAATLAESGIMLSVENTPLNCPEEFNAFFLMLEDVAPDALAHVGMCLDIGHANLCTTTQNEYLRFMDLLDPVVRISHVHLHENYGDSDSHLTVFTGPAKEDDSGIRGFVARLKKRGFSGSIILEQWPDPPILLNEARKKLTALFGHTVPVTAMSAMTAPSPSIPADGFLSLIVRGNEQNRSWRQRLSWLRDLLDESGHDMDIDLLAYLAIYLRLIATGAIRCEEDGKHYRPSHHAKIAQDIFDHLARATTAENALVIRKIYPWLPSFGRVFTKAEPLTRIRDIAHRNDIPGTLKKEIKHRLQNKLHRCAGPEDLATSAALLETITASEATYPPDFVKAFRVFHEQLKEFFNARTLDEHLEALRHRQKARRHTAKSRSYADKKAPEPPTVDLIERFLKAKQKSASFKDLVETFELLTALRTGFHKTLAQAKGAQAQDVRIAELGLEDFAFSLMSRLVNHLDAEQDNAPWPPAIRILELAVNNLRLSQFQESECQAIESELAAWRREFKLESRQHLLRLKASLDRCRRLAQSYCHRILSLFVEKAHELGRALGVSQDAINVFCEADIRSHLVFQISRALDLFFKTLRRMADMSPWDVIVTGKAAGWLADDFSADKPAGRLDGPIILLQEKVEEDEAMPETVVGVVTAQAIPHLSHLAIRLRHKGLPCAVCEDEDRFAALKSLLGKWISLDASEEVILQATTNQQEGAGRNHSPGRLQENDMPPITLCSAPSVLPLDQVELSTGGSKAFRAKALQIMSTRPGADFLAPQGLVVPFGVMEAALQAESSLGQSYTAEVSRLKGLQESVLSETLGRIRQIVNRLHIPEEISLEVSRALSTNGHVMVRSSANSEDLKGATSAGIYESIANVSFGDVADAVRQVWASLWSRRAFMARERMGIAHEQSHMAVLIQPMLLPQYAFVMHTVNPINGDPTGLYIELVVGLGLTLASGETPGHPYRFIYDKTAGQIRTLSYGSYSRSVMPGPSGGLVDETIDYSKIRLSTDDRFRDGLASRLAAIGKFVETSMGSPQDIEGVIQGKEVYLVQTRPQVAAGNRLEAKG